MTTDEAKRILLEEYGRLEPEDRCVGVIAALWDGDDKGTIVAANPAAHRLMRHEKEPLVGDTIASHYHVAGRRKDNIEELQRRGEYVFILDLYSQGKQVYLLDHCRLIRHGDERVGIIAILYDVTDLGRAQRIIQRIPAGVYVADADSVIRYVNPATAAMLDYTSPNDLIGRNLSDIYDDRSQLGAFSEKLAHRLEEWIAAGRPQGTEPEETQRVVLTKKHGNRTTVAANVRPFEGPDRRMPWREGVIRDVSAEAELETALLRLPGFYELRVGRDGHFRVHRCSGHFAKTLFGYESIEELRSIPVEQLIDAADERNIAYWREFIGRVNSSMVPQTSNPIRVRRKDGTYFHIVVNAVAYSDGAAGAVGRVGFVYDATRQVEFDRALEMRVEEKTKELQASLAANRTLLETVVHEFNAPIVGIRGICDNLIHGVEVEFEPPPLQRGQIAAVEQLCSLVLAMVKNVNLAASKEVRVTDLRWHRWEKDIIDPAFSHILPQAYNRQIPIDLSTFSVYLKGVPKHVYCNKDHMYMVFFNLFSNAVKYAKPPPAALKIRISSKYDSTEGLTLFVSDTGIGIPSGETDIIFELHTKGSNAKLVPGKGIGLWVVRRILDLYEAKIWVSNRSTPTTFALKFPPRMLGEPTGGS